ncbi:MAG: LysR family transcriptional regulator [Mesorhizobium sp.]|nr:LysR family transcriptional regulator [Mesorhizobium sp.]
MPQRFDLNALILFHDVVQARSINKAAIALDMPKSTISRRLRLLEEQLGTTLLKRGARALGLTESGQALYRRCEHIIAELEQANLQTAEMQDEMAGVLRVSMPVFFIGWVAEAIAAFAKQHPALRLEIEAHNRQVDVAEEPFDVVIHFGNAPETYHPSRKLAELPRSFYATPAYLAERGTPGAYRDLADHDLIQHQYQVRDRVFPLIERADGTSSPPTARAVANHAVLVRELVLGDLGIGLMPDIMCRQDVAEGQLVRIPLDWQCPPLSASATYLARRYAPAKMRAFLDSIAAYLQSHA